MLICITLNLTYIMINTNTIVMDTGNSKTTSTAQYMSHIPILPGVGSVASVIVQSIPNCMAGYAPTMITLTARVIASYMSRLIVDDPHPYPCNRVDASKVCMGCLRLFESARLLRTMVFL